MGLLNQSEQDALASTVGRELELRLQAIQAVHISLSGNAMARPIGDWLADVAIQRAVNLNSYSGADSTGATDSTSALLKAIQDVQNGGIVFAPAGTYLLSGRITVPDSVTIVGQGDKTVFRLSPNSGWIRSGTGTVEPFYMAGVSGAQLLNFKIDGCGDVRDATNHNVTSMVTIAGSNNCLVENVSFTNGGYVGHPTGPYLIIVSADATTDWGILDPLLPSHEPGEGVVGSSYSNTIRRCRFIQTGTNLYAFGIRVISNWSAKRAITSFTNFTKENVVERCHFQGLFDWNVVEFAGGATIHNEMKGNWFNGQTLTAWDLDKGASYNKATGNFIRSIQKTPYYTTGGAGGRQRFSAIQDHAAASDYGNVGNEITANQILNIDLNGETYDYDNAIGLQYTTGSRVAGNTVSSMTNGSGAHAAILLDSNVSDAQIESNKIDGAKNGILTNGSANPSPDKLAIARNKISVSTGNAIGLSGTAGGTGCKIIGNDLAVSGTASYVVTISSVVTAPVASDNHILGGLDGIRTAANSATMVGNVIEGVAGRSFRIANTGAADLLTGNISLTAGIGNYIVEGGATTPTLTGNNFS